MGLYMGVDDPYLMRLNLDESLICNPINCNLVCEPLMKKAIISANESKMMRKTPSSSSSSSLSSPPIVHENPNSKLTNVWDDQTKNPNSWGNYMMPSDGIGNVEEDFLQNQAALMTKIDREYMNWQQKMMNLMPIQTYVGSDFEGFDKGFEKNKVMDVGDLEKLSVDATQVAERSADSEKNSVYGDDRMSKSVERKQKRMMKNRESAARSRAKKQAYINELEHKVSQLQASNKLLRKRKEVDTLLNSNSLPAPRYQLRRTSSFS